MGTLPRERAGPLIHISILRRGKYEHPCLQPSYDLKRMVSFLTFCWLPFVSTIGFWAWTIVVLAKMYAKQMHLDAGMTSLPVAMPIFIGAIGRIPPSAV